MTTNTIARPTLNLNQRQRIVDFVFGAVAPILCLIFDPVVFKGDTSFLSSGGLLAPAKIFYYVAIGLVAVILTVWLFFRPRLAPYAAYVVGIFTIAMIVSGLLGIALFPVTIFGIGLSGVGILGLTPLLTAYVLNRQRKQALPETVGLPHRRRNMVLGAVAIILIPLAIQWTTSRYVSSAVDDLLANSDTTSSAVSRLKSAFWCGDECFSKLTFAYYKAYDDPARQQYLADTYHDITGGDIRNKIGSYSD